MEVLAKRLKWLREKKRMGQKEVAAELGMTLSAIQKLEYDERDPKLDKLISFAQFFDVSSDFLLGLSDNTPEVCELLKEMEKVELFLFHQNERLQTLQKDIMILELNKESEKDIYKSKEEQKDYFIKQIFEMEQKLDDLQDKYVLTLSDIPYSNIHKDKYFLRMQPVDIVMESKDGTYVIEVKNRAYKDMIINELKSEKDAVKLYEYYTSVLYDKLKQNKEDMESYERFTNESYENLYFDHKIIHKK